MKHHLYIYNDSSHSFNYVWACLMEVLGHQPLQAEQCCLIAHNNNKAHVKSGDIVELLEFEKKLTEKGLKVELKKEMYER